MKIQSNFMVLFLILLFSIVSFGQGEGILRYIEYHTITLTERQHELLEIIRSLPQTKEVYLVQIDESRFNIDMELIRINLPERVIEVQRNSKYQRLENRISWSGKITNVPASTILLSKDGNDVTGHINTLDKLYSIRPLTGGLQALIELDPDKFDREAPPLIPPEDDEKHKSSNKEETQFNIFSPSSTMSSDPVVDVLVAYTPQAKVNAGNIRALINEAGDLLNLSFDNSDVSASTHIVAMIEVDYIESDSLLLDLIRLRGQNDGYMDEVHQFRDDFDADFVALIVGSGDYCGIAYMPKPHQQVPTWGFSVTRYDCISGYTFSHEIGHNLGANHDIDNIPNNDPYQSPYVYGHGYRFFDPTIQRRTIMAYSPGSQINYWSNPNVTFNGVPTGTEQYENNARVWNERAPVVADFRTSPIPGWVVFDNGYTVASDNPLTIASGTNVLLNGDLVVESGAELTIQTNATLNFDNGASIYVNGTLLNSGIIQNAHIEALSGGEIIVQSGAHISNGQLLVSSDGYMSIYGGTNLTDCHIEVSSGGDLSLVSVTAMFGSGQGIIGYGTIGIAGATLKGSGSAVWDGVHIHGTGSVLSNVEIQNAVNGLSVYNTYDVSLHNIAVSGSSFDGIRIINSSVEYASSFHPDYIVANNDRYGVYYDGQYNSSFEQNILKYNMYAQLLVDGGGSLVNVNNSRIEQGSSQGIMAQDGSYMYLTTNSIHGNSYSDGYAVFSSTIDAQSNWWGQAPPSSSQFYSDQSSSIDYSNYLWWDPLPQSFQKQIAGRVAHSVSSTGGDENGSMKPAPSEIRTAADLRAALADMDYEEALRELDELSSGLREEMRPWKEIIRIELLQLLGNHAEAVMSGLEMFEDVSLDEGIRRTAGRRMFYGYLFGLKEPAAAARMITLLHDLECDEAKDGQLAWLLELHGGELHVEETLSPVSIASEFTLASYPNPFNPATVIEFSLPGDGMVNLNVYDILGRKVTTLVDDFREAGMYRVEFNAGYLPSGMYFTRLEAGGQSLIHRMLLLK